MKSYLSLIFSVFILLTAKATHNRAGEILYKRIAPFTNVVNSATVQVFTYSITIIKYTGHGTNVSDRCEDTVYFGDGQKGVAPRINGTFTCNCGTNACGEILVSDPNYTVKKNIYSIIHTYTGAGTYIVSSSDNRNGGIHNIPNSGNVAFYIESKIVISSAIEFNSSPVFSNPPTDRGLLNSCMEINACAFDSDGDSLSYELTTCKDANGQTIAGYFYPETGTGGSFSIDAYTGLITWCSPQFVDQYNIAMIVKEWRKNSCTGTYQLVGYVLRDFQVIINNFTPSTFSATNLADMCVSASATALKSFTVNSTSGTVKVYGETTSFTTSLAQISPSLVNSSASVTYSWLTNCFQARKKAYDVYLVFNMSNTEKIYRQFKLTVLPRTPFLYTPIVDSGKVTLSWNTCAGNHSGFNIYRKTGANSWVPGTCEQGVSATSGFSLVGVAPSSASSYTDTNIWPILNGTQAHYIVTAFTDDCVESIADNAQSVTLIVGISENEKLKETKVYPNPFSDKIELDFGTNHSGMKEISVFGIDGKRVLLEHVSVDKIELSTKNFNKGVYIIQIKSESAVMTKKIIKE